MLRSLQSIFKPSSKSQTALQIRSVHICIFHFSLSNLTAEHPCLFFLGTWMSFLWLKKERQNNQCLPHPKFLLKVPAASTSTAWWGDWSGEVDQIIQELRQIWKAPDKSRKPLKCLKYSEGLGGLSRWSVSMSVPRIQEFRSQEFLFLVLLLSSKFGRWKFSDSSHLS